MKYVIGFDGVLCALREFMENESIFGYIHYAIIQPEVPENAEVKIVCFDGVPAMKCKTKKGKSNRSPFGRAKREVFFDFARCVISTLRRVCPEIVSFQVLRIDIFGFRGRPGDFIVNEVEGYEAQKAGVGVDSGVEEGRILQKLEEYWTNLIYDLVEYHIKHELPRLGLKHPSEP
jgi:hypothetical protein